MWKSSYEGLSSYVRRFYRDLIHHILPPYFRGHNSGVGQQYAHNPGQRAGHQPRRDRRQRRIRIDRPRGSGFVLLLRFFLLSADQCLERSNSRESRGTFREARCDCDDDDKLMISLVSVILLRTKNLHSATGPLSLALSLTLTHGPYQE